MKLRKALSFLMVITILIAGTGCNLVEKKESTGKVIDGKEVVAKVNDEYILKSDFDIQFNQIESALKAGGQEFSSKEGKKNLDEVKRKLLDSMINDELTLQEAKKNNVKLSEGELKETIDQIEEYHGGKEALHKYIKEQGLTVKKFENIIEEQLIINKFKEKLTSDVKVTEEEVKKYYDENKELYQLSSPEIRASHILVDTEDEAKKLLSELKAGADFAELAKKYSKCPSKEKGGDLGFFGKGQMDPEFEKAAFALKPGQLSDIVKTSHGYHIIKVTDERSSLTFDDVKDYIKKELENNKKEEKFNEYLEKWKKQSKIERYM